VPALPHCAPSARSIWLMRVVGGILIWLVASAALMNDRPEAQRPQLSIDLRPVALVIGPAIRLEDVGVIHTADNSLKKKLAVTELGPAAPPGESKELTLSEIRARLRRAGVTTFVVHVTGPSAIRVTTAPAEIYKVMIEGLLAWNFSATRFVFREACTSST